MMGKDAATQRIGMYGKMATCAIVLHKLRNYPLTPTGGIRV